MQVAKFLLMNSSAEFILITNLCSQENEIRSQLSAVPLFLVPLLVLLPLPLVPLVLLCFDPELTLLLPRLLLLLPEAWDDEDPRRTPPPPLPPGGICIP